MNSAPRVTSRAVVSTDRPARYGKQLASHFGRKTEFSWDAEAETGSGSFAEGTATATLHAVEGALHLELVTTADLVERFETVIGSHLVRFGARDELVCRWNRDDHTPGSEQTNPADYSE